MALSFKTQINADFRGLFLEYKHAGLPLSSKGTNVKDLVYIHVGASEMLHFVTNDEFTICHNRMGFPQEIGTQHDK